MAVSGLQETRLSNAIMSRLKTEVGAKEKDAEGNDTALKKVAQIIAQEVIKELKQAQINVFLPAGSVVVQVTGGASAPAVGVMNSAPIQADNSSSGGVS